MLEKTKIASEQYWPINSKLWQPTFNCPKFYTISHFVQYIWNYSSVVNYNIAYSKAMHKYLLKAFSNKTSKKEYKLQIWQHNVHHTNIIAIKDVIILDQVREKEKLSEKTAETPELAKVAQKSSSVDLALRYKWAIRNADVDIAK